MALLKINPADLTAAKSETTCEKLEKVISISTYADKRGKESNSSILDAGKDYIYASVSTGGSMVGGGLFNTDGKLLGIITNLEEMILPVSTIQSAKQSLSMPIKEMCRYTYQPQAPANLECNMNLNYPRFHWAPVYGAEKYIVTQTIYADLDCPYVEPEHTEIIEITDWYSTPVHYIPNHSYEYGYDIKVAAVVNGQQTDWSETLKIRKYLQNQKPLFRAVFLII